MDSLYEQEASSDFREHCNDLSSATSSLSSAEHVGQRSGHHCHNTNSRLHRHQSGQDLDNVYSDYTRRHDATGSALHPRHRPQHHSTSLSFASSSRSTSAHPGDVSVYNNDGDFLSAVSVLPSLKSDDLMLASGVSDAVPTDEERSLVEGFPAPAWSRGSRLLERHIQQDICQETAELSATERNEGGGVTQRHGAAYWTAEAQRILHPFLTGAHWQPGPPPLAPAMKTKPPPWQNSPSASTSSIHAAASQTVIFSPTLQPRMKEAELLADPRSRLLDLVITNTAASVTLGEIEQTMRWSTRYEPMYGPLLEYLQSYQSIFVVSPVDDRVRLRKLFSTRSTAARCDNCPKAEVSSSSLRQQHPQQPSSRSRRSRLSGKEAAMQRTPSSAADRRSNKPSLPSAEALAAHIGSVSYSCIGERLHLDVLEAVYRRRGYGTTMMHAVLHVTNENDFHLFLFSSGAVVWWGMDRKDHWMVEDDFLSADTHLAEGVEHRYAQSEIEALFPIWCSYETDEQCDNMQIASPLGIQPAAVRPALERLAKVLCFDHYLVPATEPARSFVMLTFSHSLGSSARVDYFEYVTRWSHQHILSIPAEFSGLLDYFSTKRRIARLEGEIEVAQLAIQSIHDTPEVLWEVPWLQAYYDMVEQQNTAQSRLSWFASRSDTLLEQLSQIKARRHRLFMLGSDVFLIVILILDVVFMTSRLVAKMYFKAEEQE